MKYNPRKVGMTALVALSFSRVGSLLVLRIETRALSTTNSELVAETSIFAHIQEDYAALSPELSELESLPHFNPCSTDSALPLKSALEQFNAWLSLHESNGAVRVWSHSESDVQLLMAAFSALQISTNFIGCYFKAIA